MRPSYRGDPFDAIKVEMGPGFAMYFFTSGSWTQANASVHKWARIRLDGLKPGYLRGAYSPRRGIAEMLNTGSWSAADMYVTYILCSQVP